VGYDLVSTHI